SRDTLPLYSNTFLIWTQKNSIFPGMETRKNRSGLARKLSSKILHIMKESCTDYFMKLLTTLDLTNICTKSTRLYGSSLRQEKSLMWGLSQIFIRKRKK